MVNIAILSIWISLSLLFKLKSKYTYLILLMFVLIEIYATVFQKELLVNQVADLIYFFLFYGIIQDFIQLTRQKIGDL